MKIQGKIAVLTAVISLCVNLHAQRPSLTIPAAHSAGANSIDFSKDGKFIVTGSTDKSFIIWDAKTGFIIRQVKTSDPVQQVIFTPDASQLITITGESNNKGMLQRWEAATGKLLGPLPFSASRGLQFLHQSGYLLVPDYSQGDAGKGKPNLLALMAKQSASEEDEDSIDAEIERRMEKLGEPDLSNPQKLAEYQRKAMDITMEVRMGINPFVSNITLVDLKTLKPVAMIRGTPEKLDVLYHNNKEYLVTQLNPMNGETGQIEAWEVAALTGEYRLKKEPSPSKTFPVDHAVHSLTGSQSLGFFATNTGESGIQLLQFDKNTPLTLIKTKGRDIDGMEFSSNGSILYTYSNNFPYRFIEGWSTGTFRKVLELELPGTYLVDRIMLSPQDEYFLANNKASLVKLNLNGDNIGEFANRAGIVSNIGFISNDDTVFVKYNDIPDMGDIFRQSFRVMIEDRIKENGLQLSEEQKKEFIDKRIKDMDLEKGWLDRFNLAWDLLKGKPVQYADVKPSLLKTISKDNNYTLYNDKIGSPAARGKQVLDLLFNADTTDMSEEDRKEMRDAKNMMTGLKDKDKIFADSLNGFMTHLVNRRTKDTISLISIDTSDWVMLLKNGYYMTSKNGAKALSYTKGMDIYPFEQFDLQYNRPDIVLKAIGKADPELIEAYRKAYLKRLEHLNIDTSQFGSDFNMPEAHIQNRSSIRYNQESDQLKLSIVASDGKALLDRYNVWVNDVPVFGKLGKSMTDKRSGKLAAEVTITLSQGRNRIETSVFNSKGVESIREPLFVNYTPAVPIRETVFFIGIGIDRFSDASRNLKYCEKDIRDLAKEFKQKYGDALQSTLLINEQATLSNIEALKNILNTSKENDKIIIAYAGHGMLDSNYYGYLSTYAMNFNDPAKEGLSYEKLESLVDGIKARKKLILIDACNSGGVDKKYVQQVMAKTTELRKNNIENVSFRGGNGEETKLSLENSFEVMQTLFADVSRGTGTMIIAAASGTQFAREVETITNGIFTRCVLDLLRNNKTITVNGLNRYVSDQVANITKGFQQPVTRGEVSAIDWKVW